MALDASSTIDEIVAQYIDSSLYDVNGSVAECRDHIQACRILLVKRPASITTDGVSTRFNSAAVESDLGRALSYYSAKNGGRSRVRTGDISDVGRW